MLRHKKSAHSDVDSGEDAISDTSVQEDIFGPVPETVSDSSDDEDDDVSITSEDSVDIDP